MSGGAAQLLLHCAAFWTAVALFERSGDTHDHGRARFAFGLLLGAVLSHLGWSILHLDAVSEHPWAVLDPTMGFCVLFVPLGVLLVAPWNSAVGSLPLAFAVARLGCLAAGCCRGPVHPTPVYEIAGLLVLHVASRRVGDRQVVPLVLGGFGLIRLSVEPLRTPPPLGEPMISASWIAVLWIAVALGFSLTGSLRRERAG